MKVKELIEKLKKANPEAKVFYYDERTWEVTNVEHDEKEYDEVWLSSEAV